MEELRSTEALDREILEDARRKADRVLRGAEQAAAEAEAGWAKKLAEDLAALERKHAERVAAKRAETNARLPLDKRRLRAERAERLLRGAMDRTLRALPRDRLLAVLERGLAERAGELPPADLTVRRAGLTEGEASALLGRFLPRSTWTFDADAPADGSLPRLAISGGKTTVRVDAAEIGQELLREKRAELAQALLGTEALDD